MTRLQLDGRTIVVRFSWLDSRWGQNLGSFSLNFSPFLQPIQLLIKWMSGASFLGKSGHDVKLTTPLNPCLG